jgi:hypothetical protein
VGLERGPLSLENTTEELLEIKSRDSGLENREYGRCADYATLLYPQKLALTLLRSGGRSELFLLLFISNDASLHLCIFRGLFLCKYIFKSNVILD